MDLDFKLIGADQLIDKMSAFTSKLQEAAGRRAARKALIPVRTEARDLFRRHDIAGTPNRIWKNLYIQQSRRGSKRVGGVLMKLGVLGGARKTENSGSPGGDTWYWRFIELGTEKQPALRILTSSLQSKAETVAATLVSELSKEIDKLAAEKK